ncbi:TlpA disulfide reductase family protein [uncultured Arcticibacterium sp.]|uniref:TlpA family protein disulfide reductase n=1 Tax=uncultured Arcticibacterium sp. TaxID=2173042 RepID=UPI0030F659D2
MNWIKKNYGNVLWGLFIVLLFIPQTGTPIKVFINRILAFSPSVEMLEDRKTLEDYKWKLMDMEGRVVNFTEFKGKKILVNFWATWCPPCIAEMPSMQALYNDYKDKAVFVFVSNEDKAAIDKFIAKRKFDLPIYQALNPPPALLEGNSLPTTYLIDESGAVLIEKTGSADWNSDNVRDLLD